MPPHYHWNHTDRVNSDKLPDRYKRSGSPDQRTPAVPRVRDAVTCGRSGMSRRWPRRLLAAGLLGAGGWPIRPSAREYAEVARNVHFAWHWPPESIRLDEPGAIALDPPSDAARPGRAHRSTTISAGHSPRTGPSRPPEPTSWP